MAEHNALSYATTLSHAAAIASGLGSEEDGLSRLSETLSPMMDLWRELEWAFLRSERHFARYVNTSTAPAGRFASFELVNPVGSRHILIVKQLRQASSPDFDVGVDLGGSIAANPVAIDALPLDTRGRNNAGGFLFSIGQLTMGDVAAGVVNPQWHLDTIEGGTTPGFILLPGSKLFCIATTAVTDLQCNVWWAERNLFPGEERG